MYDGIISLMRAAARAKIVILSEHARDELAADSLGFADVLHCILTGDIIEQQFDVRRGE